MVRFGVDTSVIIAAMTPSEPAHKDSHDLFAFAREGHVELLVASTFEYDQESDLDADRLARRQKWLAHQQVTRVSGPFTLDVSILGFDALVSDEQGELFQRLRDSHAGNTSSVGFARRQYLDLHHFEAAAMNGADAFTTLDQSRILKRLRAAGAHSPIPVITPGEACHRVSGQGEAGGTPD